MLRDVCSDSRLRSWTMTVKSVFEMGCLRGFFCEYLGLYKRCVDSEWKLPVKVNFRKTKFSNFSISQNLQNFPNFPQFSKKVSLRVFFLPCRLNFSPV